MTANRVPHRPPRMDAPPAALLGRSGRDSADARGRNRERQTEPFNLTGSSRGVHPLPCDAIASAGVPAYCARPEWGAPFAARAGLPCNDALVKISVFGLGYVGTVTAACLARDGHEIFGVDVNPEKVALIGAGESPIVEPGLDVLLAEGVRAGRIRAGVDAAEAVMATEVSLISVGTPPGARGEPELSYVFEVCRQIAEAVHAKGGTHIVVVRSTVPPGTLARCAEVVEEVVGPGRVHLAFNPEFLREGAAVADYDAPPYTVIGAEDPVAEAAVRQMYAGVEAPILVVAPALAEMVKYISNTWHAAKVAFANEIGRVARAFGVDGREAMAIVAQDTKLNISPAYLRPGFAYGGSCLPKDLMALLSCARGMDVDLPFLSAIPRSNDLQIELAAREVLRLGARRVAVFGLAFKPGTDDLRESPAVPLVKRLLGEGCSVRIFDQPVQEARLMGTNLAYIRGHLPHFEELLAGTAEEALEGAELIVVTQNAAEFRELLAGVPTGTRVLDLAGIFREPPPGVETSGLGW